MDANVSRLISLGPPGTSEGELELTRDYMTLGRSHSNDLVLQEPSVSRVHASLTVGHDGSVSVQDLGSSTGTTVNGRPASGRVILRSGDVIAFGGARFRYQDAATTAEPTAALPVQRHRQREGDVQGRYDIESQHAGNISNVAGNQYVSHIMQERESFLQAVAATRTKARWLIWIGAGLSILGLVVAGAGFYQFMEEIPSYSGDGPPPAFRLYISGLFIAGGGSILLTIGVVLHIVATSRRKRVDREFPLPRARGYSRTRRMIGMGFNINNQTGGVINNVEGNQYIRGDQRSQMVQSGAVREAVQELERGVVSLGLPDHEAAAVLRHVKKIDEEVSSPHPDPGKVADPLRKITEIASAAGALASLAGPIQTLVTWLGPLGEPIARLLAG